MMKGRGEILIAGFKTRRFFERIGKTYRKEGWHTVLTSILRWSLRCAKELGARESAIEYLVELMAGREYFHGVLALGQEDVCLYFLNAY